MPACCYLGAHPRNQLDLKFPSRWTDGTPYSSSDLLLLPSTLPNYSKSNYLSPFYSLGQNKSKSNFLFPLLFGQNYSKSKFPLLFVCFGLKILTPTRIIQNYSKFNFFLTQKNFLLLLTCSILLPLESKQIPLTASFGIGEWAFRGRT